LDTAISGIHLAGVFAYAPSPKLPPRRIEAIFGKEQLRDNELLEAFAAHLPGFVAASTPETSRSFMERLILENKLWEQLHVSLSESYDTILPFPDKLRIIMAFYDILDVAFEVLKDSSKIPWHSQDFYFLNIHLDKFWAVVLPSIFIRPVIHLRAAIAGAQVPHLFLAQFSIQRSRGEPLVLSSFDVLVRLISIMGLGGQEDRDYFLSGSSSTYDPNMMVRAETILSEILRDGPLLNFCRLGRWTFEVMLSETSDVSSEDMKRPLKTLRRMLDPALAPGERSGRDVGRIRSSFGRSSWRSRFRRWRPECRELTTTCGDARRSQPDATCCRRARRGNVGPNQCPCLRDP
jgi:hypothetical protein